MSKIQNRIAAAVWFMTAGLNAGSAGIQWTLGSLGGVAVFATCAALCLLAGASALSR